MTCCKLACSNSKWFVTVDCHFQNHTTTFGSISKIVKTLTYIRGNNNRIRKDHTINYIVNNF
jgi:hypothetical protein